MTRPLTIQEQSEPVTERRVSGVYVIESGVPLPAHAGREGGPRPGPIVTVLRMLDVGQSVVIDKSIKRIGPYIFSARKRTEKRFSASSVSPDKCRVWRVK